MRDEERLTESFLTWILEDTEKEWLPSGALRANKDFSTVVPTTRDKCLTEGYSPSCGILMICSRHTLISLVVHEALWHTWCAGLSVRAQPYVVCSPFLCRSQLWHPSKKKIKPILWWFFQLALNSTLIIQQLTLGRYLKPRTGRDTVNTDPANYWTIKD